MAGDVRDREPLSGIISTEYGYTYRTYVRTYVDTSWGYVLYVYIYGKV